MSRVRVRFTKLGKPRWTSHRDVARMWERAFRRVQLPVAYSEGFTPRPKVSFGLALPTGHESLAEYLDVELADGERGLEALRDLPALPGRLSAALPEGVDAVAAAVLPPGAASLQEEVTSCTWRWVAVPTAGVLDAGTRAGRCAQLLAAPTLVLTRQRKGRDVTDDVRDAVLDLRVLGPAGPPHAGGVRLQAELACRPRSLRPAELLAGLGEAGSLEERDARRLHQWIARDGARREPLEAPGMATDAPHAPSERAS
ncbi:MAG: TIGR03936 family radical SAM-associated protein [Acidimicrobiales bacterium]